MEIGVVSREVAMKRHAGFHVSNDRALCYLVFAIAATVLILAIREGVVSLSQVITPGFLFGF